MSKSEWQPIETAPKDGTYFLGYGPECRTRFLHTEDGFLYEGENYTPYYWFTHWMPLPEPPEEV